jgi:EAL domain-containing protein (putative c-di-GMP-specific phosphodiesterase class I)
LCFEITESAAISNIDHVMAFMRVLKRLGVRFALDDFGAGMSSFAYIRSLPIDYLKIDGYFIRNIRADNTSRAITAALIGLSRELGLQTVAEAVEDKATRRAVTALGIDYVQGFGIERPRDVDDVLAEAVVASVSKAANG